jgi:Tol biopolymer transport system component
LVAVCDGRLHLFDAPSRDHVLPLVAGEIADPALSPDGTRVAFARLRGGHWHLYELDLTRSVVRPLAAGRGDERGPRYSPDGEQLVFSRRVGGCDALWIRNVATGAERRLSRSTGNDDQPVWSDDGRSVYFASDRGRGIFMPAIYRLDLAP